VPLIRPFRGLRPAPQRAAEVIAPPYDVLSREEAYALAADRPWSFLHISRPEIDLAPGVDPYAAEVYARGAANFAHMIEQGVLVRDPSPRYYVYRLQMGAHTQTGLVVTASVAAYRAGRIRRHEFTRPEKEDDRVRQIEALGAQTGPVLLAYRDDPDIDAALAQIAAGAPEVDVEGPGGVRHSVWPVADAQWCARVSARFEAMPRLYIADGHHRSAAAARVAEARGGDDSAPYAYFLAVAFPAGQMRILDYNRVVRDLNGLSPEALLERLREAFAVEPASAPVAPARPGEFGLYVAGRWWRLSLDPARIPDDPVARLDVSLLTDRVLAPVLGIGDLRRDPRIDFVGGIRGLGELERRVDGGGAAAAFSLRPTPMRDLMAVADAGEVMPPKSTWFEPKLADGLVSHVLD